MKNSPTWIRVRRSSPCEICHAPDWCSRSGDGQVVCCMRVQSDKPVKSGGWIHRLDATLPIAAYLERTRKTEPTKLSAEQVAELAKVMYEHSSAAGHRRDLASKLGVFEWALDWLRVGYGSDKRGIFASFPSKDENGWIIGITRRYGDGSKMTYPGTRNSGLFYELDWYKNKGSLLVVEGGSDVAACVSERLVAIGRPSNIGGGQRIASMLKAVQWTRKVVVVGERDQKPEKRGNVPGCDAKCRCCPQCYPGLWGARKVAMELGQAGFNTVVKMPQRAKDAREMHNLQELRQWAQS